MANGFSNTDSRRAFPNYPDRATNRGRAVIGIKSVGTFDLGLHDSPESVLTWHALKKIYQADKPIPAMRELRAQVIRELSPTAEESYREIERSKDALQKQVIRLECAMETVDDLEQSLDDTVKQRDELKEKNASLNTLASKRLWHNQALLFAAVFAWCATAWVWIGLEPKVAGRVLSALEVESIEGIRTGDLKVHKADLPPELDGVVLTEIEQQTIRTMRERMRAAMEEALDPTTPAGNAVQNGEVIGWLREKLEERSR